MYFSFVFFIISVFCTCRVCGDALTPENARGAPKLYLPLTLYKPEGRETAVGEPWVAYVVEHEVSIDMNLNVSAVISGPGMPTRLLGLRHRGQTEISLLTSAVFLLLYQTV
jgi:hypothetical protein